MTKGECSKASPLFRFDCGHSIPMLEHERMKIQPFCAKCKKPKHPTVTKLIPPIADFSQQKGNGG